jgi:hypothetical protein
LDEEANQQKNSICLHGHTVYLLCRKDSEKCKNEKIIKCKNEKIIKNIQWLLFVLHFFSNFALK